MIRKPQNKKVGIFGSFGWAGGASEAIRKEIVGMGLEVLEPPFEVQYVPHEEDLSRLDEYAKIIIQAARS